MLRKFVAAVVLSPPVLVGFGCASDRLLELRYRAVERGETETQVLSNLGQPRRITGAPENVSWGSEASIRPNSGQCVKQFWFRPIINVVDEEYTVGFDSAGRVVSKWVSRSGQLQ